MKDKLPRGIRNNNPGNIRRTGESWKGLSKAQIDNDFFRFDDPVYGIRALMVILINYQKRYGLRSISSIIRRYAPSSENDTAAYIQSVSKHVGIEPDTQVFMGKTMLISLAKAIIMHENGKPTYDLMKEGYPPNWYVPFVFEKAANMALEN